MSQEDSLKLAAEIVDRFSGPLREMTKSVHAFQDTLKGAHTEGSKGAKEQTKQQLELHDSFEKTARTLTGFMTPSMAALGLSVGGASGAMALMIGKLKDAGDSFYRLQGAMARTGMGQTQLEAYAETISRISKTSVDSAREQMAGLGDIAAKLRRQYSPEVQALESTFSNLSPLIAKMAGESGDKAADDFWQFYLSHPAPPDQERKLLQAFGIDPNVANATAAQFREALQEQLDSFADHPPPAMKTLKALSDAFDNLDISLGEMGRDFTNTFGTSAAGMIDGLAEHIRGFTGEITALKQVFDAMPTWMGGGGKAVPGSPFQPLPEGGLPPAERKPPWTAKGLPPLDGGGGYHPMSFTTGGGDAETTFSRGVERGTLSALQQWYAALQDRGRNGVLPASYTSGGTGGGASGLHSGGGYSVMSGDTGGNLPGGGPHPLPGGTGNNAGGGGSGSVPSGSGPRATGMSGNARDTAKIVADEWRRAGMSNEGIAGLMANIKDESGFNPSLRHPDQPKFGGEAHFAHGLYQEGGTEWNHYASWLQQNHPGADWRDPRLQSRFAAENLKANYKGTWDKMLHGDRFHAGAAYVNEYLKPAAGPRGARMSKYLHGGVGDLEQYTEAPTRDLLSNAQAAGVGGVNKVADGAAHIELAFKNAPPGVQAYMKYNGLFKSGKVDWGHAMPSSDPGG